MQKGQLLGVHESAGCERDNGHNVWLVEGKMKDQATLHEMIAF